MAFGIWEVSGSFIIPGARKKGTLSPIRVVAKDRFKASEDLAGVLNEKFRRDLKAGQYFTKHNLNAEQVTAPQGHRFRVRIASSIVSAHAKIIAEPLV